MLLFSKFDWCKITLLRAYGNSIAREKMNIGIGAVHK